MANKNVIFCDSKYLEKDLSGKTYIVTGANSGVGFETTQQLVKQGAHVVMACRRVDAGNEVAQPFSTLKGSYEVIKCDLADLQSVRDFVDTFLSKYSKLDGLACNAGMVNMENAPKYTKDGFEITMAASFYGHFLLTELLLETLKNTINSRMLILSSVVHAGSKKKRHQLHFDDLEWKNRKYNNFDAYSEAKLASILYAKELAERLKETSVTTYSVHPGWARSNFGSGGNALMRGIMALTKPFVTMLNFSDSSWESAQTSLHCLLSDEAPKHSGRYFSQHSVLYNDKECRKGGWPMQSPNPNADNMNDAKKLVGITRGLVGLN
ncbi:SDR family NAD(P)-dependent oxidoreductase [Flammeovirga sp. OC4]|uniref:SDR family NAD(P)-dependent oxidoreductase n=1 Tax=Flammeovirga sp. OC4 TaxID=1382345 RepID=UPI0009E51F7D|nr:SDR family NAD(P)-dependent oxidoreductase [Flammeovirga sp. OC4]